MLYEVITSFLRHLQGSAIIQAKFFRPCQTIEDQQCKCKENDINGFYMLKQLRHCQGPVRVLYQGPRFLLIVITSYSIHYTKLYDAFPQHAAELGASCIDIFSAGFLKRACLG